METLKYMAVLTMFSSVGEIVSCSYRDIVAGETFNTTASFFCEILFSFRNSLSLLLNDPITYHTIYKRNVSRVNCV